MQTPNQTPKHKETTENTRQTEQVQTYSGKTEGKHIGETHFCSTQVKKLNRTRSNTPMQTKATTP